MRIDRRTLLGSFILCLFPLTVRVGPALSADHDVTIRCLGTPDGGCELEIQPNPVVLVAGEDRVRWAADTCLCGMAFVIEVCPWGEFNGCPGILWSGGSTPLQGPFCEPRTLVYDMHIRGSHGEIQYWRTGQIQVVAPGAGSAGSLAVAPRIGVFADSGATSCSLISGPGQHRAWVYALFEAPTSCALAGTEFRITGFPEEWRPSVSPVYPGHSADYGWALLQDGESLSFPECQGAPSGAVLLYTIGYYATAESVSSTVRVEGPVGSRYPCPRAILCNGSERVETCAIGGLAYFNMPAASCVVANAGTTWSGVKQLYRDAGPAPRRGP